MNLKTIFILSIEILRKIIRNIRTKGLKVTFHTFLYYSYEFYWRLRFNIIELKLIHLKEVGIDNEQCHYYSHSDFLDFRKVMKELKINTDKDIFIDFGSGMGTTVLMAAMYPFYKVIGVEISKEFNSVAEDLIKQNKSKLRCKNIELNLIDATTYIIPNEVNFIYFYNPFHGEVLDKVIDNIKTSLKKAPRELFIIFKNTEHFEKIETISEWLIEQKRLKCFWGHDCVIYKARLEVFK